MPDRSVASSVKAPYRLTEAEWQEISDSSVALSAVWQQMDGTGQGSGVFELRESVQRRVGRTVLLIENRVAGHGECPTCGAGNGFFVSWWLGAQPSGCLMLISDIPMVGALLAWLLRYWERM